MKARNVLRPHAAWRLRGGLWLLVAAAVLILVLPSAASAAKVKKIEITTEEKEEFSIFKNCPLTEAVACVWDLTSGGEFVIGSKTVPLTKPILLQGGLAGQYMFLPVPLIAAVPPAETMQKVPETDPGGLTGIEGLGGEVTATAELAGPVSSALVNSWGLATQGEPAVTLPLKVHLSNEVLGENCYIGSEAEPILLHLTAGKTDPPEGVEPISGSRERPNETNAGIAYVKKVVLVDNTFSVPGVHGCGNVLDEAIIDQVIDTDIGLPSAAGKNVVKMDGETKLAKASKVDEYLFPPPTAKEKKQKEKEQKQKEKEQKKKEKEEAKGKS